MVIIRDQDGKQNIGLVELGNMDVKIKYDKLFSAFEKMMEPYSDLDHTEKSYDYWVQEKGRYVDFDVFNFYEDPDEDWENDDVWIYLMQWENPWKYSNKELFALEVTEDFIKNL